MQPGAKCLISTKSAFRISVSAWSKNPLWVSRNHNEVAVAALLAGQWPGPRMPGRKGQTDTGGEFAGCVARLWLGGEFQLGSWLASRCCCCTPRASFGKWRLPGRRKLFLLFNMTMIEPSTHYRVCRESNLLAATWKQTEWNEDRCITSMENTKWWVRECGELTWQCSLALL